MLSNKNIQQSVNNSCRNDEFIHSITNSNIFDKCFDKFSDTIFIIISQERVTLVKERENIMGGMGVTDYNIKLDTLVCNKLEEYPFRIEKMKAELKVIIHSNRLA